ncbi:hypothetical protein FBZ88_12973 [Nitrospirillum bahiense]|uniref:Uncharacterized protein n=1 Tax=Nitrospirillum amazonense TaxID=28077 RepID=A0A560F1X1_9PROT|nr:hypothetical protein FBZ88_12973 [Nitrospirillum amazonense]
MQLHLGSEAKQVNGYLVPRIGNKIVLPSALSISGQEALEINFRDDGLTNHAGAR